MFLLFHRDRLKKDLVEFGLALRGGEKRDLIKVESKVSYDFLFSICDIKNVSFGLEQVY